MSGQYLKPEVEKDVIELESLPALKKPRKYKVILVNDDYTPMVFVTEVLKRFFQMNDAQAVQVMLQIHTQGKAVCGIYTREIAETKVVWVNDYARHHEHPLVCQMEPE